MEPWRPKWTPGDLNGGKTAPGTPREAKWSPMVSPARPKETQETPRQSKRDPREAKRDPRGTQDSPRGTQERPREAQETPKRPQERPKRGQKTPKRTPRKTAISLDVFFDFFRDAPNETIGFEVENSWNKIIQDNPKSSLF